MWSFIPPYDTLRIRRLREGEQVGSVIDPAEIGAWISQAKAQRLQAEADLRKITTTARLARHQIDELITSITDIAATLDNAQPAQLADAYDKLGLRLSLDPAGPTVHATANPRPGNIGNWSVSEGGLVR